MHTARRPLSRTWRTPPTAVLAAGALGMGAILGGCASTSALALTEGDCLVRPVDDAPVTDVTTTSCTDAHDAEVVGVTTVRGDDLPQSDVLDAQAQDDCLQAFQAYVGIDYPSSSLDLTWMVPTRESWDTADDREIVCIAYAGEPSSLVQSVKDSRL